jgi:M6 family metalloprotease-like protein
MRFERIIRYPLLCLIGIIFLELPGARILSGDGGFKPDEAVITHTGAEKPVSTLWPRNINPLHVLIVFTKWKGESPGDSLAPYWANDLFNGQPGSIDDYFKSVSFQQYKVTGEYYRRVIEMPADTTYYRKSDVYSFDVIQILDQLPDFSFAKYDNDGIDGIPNSGDDDGFVDYIILMPRSHPYDFIYKNANGVMNLSLRDPYTTGDTRPFGSRIIVDQNSGCIAVARQKSVAMGTIVAEISHAYGALDLMDKMYETPETDSAGAGYWDVLAWGATGWAGSGIPMGPCAYNRMLMNCVGINNANLVELYGAREDIRIKPVGDPDGKVYRIRMSDTEYYLIENRSKESGFFYDMQIPRSGLCIWHVNERESNSSEEMKLCDLECADGRYRDRGYPLGTKPDPIQGRDNLDFWSRDISYLTEYNGNMGDETDVFDGVTYTEFSDRTNPNSRSEHNRNYSSGIEVYNIRREGIDIVFDCLASLRPAITPPSLPVLGAAYQRSKANTPARPEGTGKTVYLVNSGPNARPNLLVTESGQTLQVRDVASLQPYQLNETAFTSLTGGRDPGNASISRENISPETFSAVVREFNISPADITGGKALRTIQKVVLEESRQKLPFVLQIRQNHPNPFNAETTIPYLLSGEGPVMLEVYNILGQKVLESDQGWRMRGAHAAHLSAEGLASGIYFYRLRGAAVSQTKRFTLIR